MACRLTVCPWEAPRECFINVLIRNVTWNYKQGVNEINNKMQIIKWVKCKESFKNKINKSLLQSFSFSSFLKINLFIYFWLRWVFIAVHRLSLVAASSGYSSLRCGGFSLWWLLLLRSTGSRRTSFSSCGSRALERRLRSCGARA